MLLFCSLALGQSLSLYGHLWYLENMTQLSLKFKSQVRLEPHRPHLSQPEAALGFGVEMTCGLVFHAVLPSAPLWERGW